MHTRTSKRRRLIIRTVVSTVMTMSVLLVATVLLFIMLGYRFNKQQGAFQQGGLVQFITTPVGARVTVGEAKLANVTPSKITMIPGTYPVTMERKGYGTWRKTVEIKAGSILWLNSARLVPNDLKTTKIVNYPTIGAVEFSPAGKYAAVLQDATKPTITLLEIDRTTAKPTELALPETAYSKGESHQFSFGDWGPAERYLTMRHTFDGRSEWLVVDTKELAKSHSIPPVGETYPVKVDYDPRSNTSLFVLYSDGALRTYQTQSHELSEPLLNAVQSFSFVNNQHVLYVTKPTNGVTTVGYQTLGKATPRTISSYTTNEPVAATAARYYEKYNLATSLGANITIVSLSSLPNSDSTETLHSKQIASLHLPQPATKLETHAGGRFITALQSTTQTVYDLELQKQSDVPVQKATPPLKELNWFDDYNFYSTSGGMLRFYEFDGSNQHDITSVVEGMPAMFSDNNKYLYTVAKTESGYQIQATTMILE